MRMRFGLAGCLLLLGIGGAAAAPPEADQPLALYAAGSLSAAMTEALQKSGIPADRIAPPVFGPSGVLRQRIEQGARADILASADMAQAEKLAAERGHVQVQVFARNAMCLLARPALDITPANMLDKLLMPSLRLATSTPGADPGGDYAWAVFARAGGLRPGATQTLEAKAMPLVGGPDSKPLVPGKGQVQGVFLADRADVMLGYCSGAPAVIADVPGLLSVPLPADLTVHPAYGMVVLTRSPLARRFATFVLSPPGQAILVANGFLPARTAPVTRR